MRDMDGVAMMVSIAATPPAPLPAPPPPPPPPALTALPCFIVAWPARLPWRGMMLLLLLLLKLRPGWCVLLKLQPVADVCMPARAFMGRNTFYASVLVSPALAGVCSCRCWMRRQPCGRLALV